MRITHVLTDFSYEKYVLSREIIESLGDTYGFSLIAPKELRIEEKTAGRVKIFSLNDNYKEAGMLRKVFILSRKIAEDRADAVHFFSCGALPLLSARISGVKRIILTEWEGTGRRAVSIPARGIVVAHRPEGIAAGLPDRTKDGVIYSSCSRFNLTSRSADGFSSALSPDEKLVLFDVRDTESISLCLRALALVCDRMSVKGAFVLRKERFCTVYREASFLGILDRIFCLIPSDAANIDLKRCVCAVYITGGVRAPLSFLYFSSLGVPSLVERFSPVSNYVREGQNGLCFMRGSATSLYEALSDLLLGGALHKRLVYGSYLTVSGDKDRSIVSEYGRIYTSLMPT